MKPTTYWSWSLKNLHGRGRHVIRGKYTEEAAHRCSRGRPKQKVLGTEEIRTAPRRQRKPWATSSALGWPPGAGSRPG